MAFDALPAGRLEEVSIGPAFFPSIPRDEVGGLRSSITHHKEMEDNTACCSCSTTRNEIRPRIATRHLHSLSGH